MMMNRKRRRAAKGGGETDLPQIVVSGTARPDGTFGVVIVPMHIRQKLAASKRIAGGAENEIMAERSPLWAFLAKGQIVELIFEDSEKGKELLRDMTAISGTQEGCIGQSLDD